MNQVNSPDGTVPTTPQLSAEGGNTNVDLGSLSLVELNQMLGRQYADVPTALAAIKETYAFVGKKVEPVVAVNPAPVATPSMDNMATKDEVKRLSEDLFYSQNPQYQEFRPLISKMGANPAEVVASVEFKPLFEKATTADANKTSSVVHSNARLSQPSTKVDEAIKAANDPGFGSERLAQMLAQGVLEDYGIGE